MSNQSPRSGARCLWLIILALQIFTLRGSELDELVAEALEASPAILAARLRVEQMLLKYDELDEFFDPAFFALAGKADSARDLPGTTDFTSPSNDSYEAKAGFQVPVNPGAYLTIGGARRIIDNVSGHDDLYQTLYGVRIRVPLLKDRAFKSVSLDRALAMAEYNSAVSKLLQTEQELRRDIEIAYITAYENLSSYQVAKDATRRFQALQDEALELSKLNVIPEYQIFQSRLELQTGMEDEEKARVKFEIGLEQLANIAGITRKLALAGNAADMLTATAETEALPLVDEADACMARGDYLAAKNSITMEEARLNLIKEQQQDRLDVNFGITAQGEHESNPFGMNQIVSNKKVGTEIALVWTRSIDYRGPKARAAASRARILELNQELRKIQLDIRTAMLTASMKHKAALTRLRIVSQGMDAARETLAAEQERFRLGEGTSSNVTDAQKNLTGILQRRTAAMADLLRSKAEYMHSAGYYVPEIKDEQQKGE